MNPLHYSIESAGQALRQGSLSPLELVSQALSHIARSDCHLKAWARLRHEEALRDAREMGRLLREGTDLGPLHGIPVGIKDIIDVAGMPTECNSPLRKGHVAKVDADIVKRLREAGAIVLGKTVTTQFACFDPPPTRNPFDNTRTPGGSSSGSAVALAAHMCFLTIGSQTGGSIIRPATYCGVAGLKPTFDRLSRDGVFPVADSLDHVGPMARTASDLALAWEALAGERLDAGDVRGRKIGVPDRYFQQRASAEMWDRFTLALETVEKLGMRVRTVRLPASFEDGAAAGPVVMAVEAAKVHRQAYDTHKDSFLPKIRSLLDDGRSVSAVAYLQAMEAKRAAAHDMRKLFEEIDYLATPATPKVAPPADTTGDPAFNSPFSTFGLPAITVNMGLTVASLPCGLQLVSAPGRELALLEAAAAFERGHPNPRPVPSVLTNCVGAG